MGRDKRNEAKAEHFTKMIRTTMETPAWRALPSVAQALYPWLKLEWRGPETNNNGRIKLSLKQAADRLGVRPHTAGGAFHALQAKGFIVQTEGARLGTGGAAKAPAYELTEIPMPGSEKPEGRKLYRNWRDGDDFPVKRTSPNNPAGRNGTKMSHVEKRHDTMPKSGMTGPATMSKSGMAHAEKRHETGLSGPATMPKSGISLPTRHMGEAERGRADDSAPPERWRAAARTRGDGGLQRLGDLLPALALLERRFAVMHDGLPIRFGLRCTRGDEA